MRFWIASSLTLLAMTSSNRRLHAGLQNLQPLAETKRVEADAQILRVLPEVRPAIGMNGHDHGVRKRARGLDRVVGVHGEMEGTAGLRGAGEWQHHAAVKTPRDLCDAVEPGGVAGDID